jgi:tRNA pseudouridine32 synthase/23S rRNA pseudouridine746 synthase
LAAAGATRSHSIIRSLEAEVEVERFYDEIRAAGTLGGVPVASLDNTKGNMIGVLLCVDAGGNTQVLRAFSGFINESGVSAAPGCSPMIPPPNPAQIPVWQAELDQVLLDIPTANAACVAPRQAYAAAQALDAAELGAVQGQITAIYRTAGVLKPAKDAQAAPLLAQKAAIELRSAPQKAQLDLAVAAVRALEQRRDLLRAQIADQYEGARLLTNFAGQTQTVRNACNAPDAATQRARVSDGRTGVCAAPKMIAQAQSLGLTPVAIAEIWIGRDLGTQRDFANGRAFVPSCECCRSILGFALCGLQARQDALATQLGA